MQYRKPHALMLLTLMALGVALSSPAYADSADKGSRTYFKGPTSTCLSRSMLIYPCVSLSPSAYLYSGVGVMPITPALDLPLDSGIHDNNWLEEIKNEEYWSKWHLSSQLQDPNKDYSLNHSETAVNMDIGPLKFNVFSESGNISVSGFSLGIERSW